MSINQPTWLLYGASGYTGRRITEESVRRGLKPILAGRNARQIGAMAATLGCQHRVFALGQADVIAQHLRGVQAVLHCAGPFSATAAPMMDACIAAKAHYLDITGEIAAIEAAAARNQAAIDASVTLIPAVGMDVVPSDCLAAMLVAKLPGATELQLAFAGMSQISPGTARTVLEGLPQGGRVRINGRITRVPLAWKSTEVPFRDGRRWATTIPWGDVASAWYSTGIPNIEVYAAMPQRQIAWLRRLRALLPLLRLPMPGGLVRRLLQRFFAGETNARSGRGTSFWGRARDGQGNAVEATLQAPEGYWLTVLTALASLERVLAGSVPAGFQTPSRAFGPEFILGIPGTDVQWVS